MDCGCLEKEKRPGVVSGRFMLSMALPPASVAS
jgi:hypothetical protein